MKRPAAALSGIGSLLVNLALALLVSALCLVMAEWAIGRGLFGVPPITAEHHLDLRELARRAAIARGEPFDEREVVDVIRSERAKGRRAFYAISPAYYTLPSGSRVMIDGKPVVPIGIVPNASSYYCNESGSWAEFRADRHGLRNPDAVWDLPITDVLLVGDSFAWGSCLAEESSIGGRIRARVAATINAAIGANGPLTALAAIREIAPTRKPKQVFWLFFENDFEDLKREKAVAVLPNYLDRGFSQRLLELSPKTGPLVEKLADEYFAALERVQIPGPRAEPFYTLPQLRRLIGFLRRPQAEPVPADLDSFRQIIVLAKADVESNGGRLHFVYIPDCPVTDYRRESWREPLFRMLEELRIPVIDTDPIIKAMQARGVAAYFYCPASHFNPAGAAAAADAILGVLR